MTYYEMNHELMVAIKRLQLCNSRSFENRSQSVYLRKVEVTRLETARQNGVELNHLHCTGGFNRTLAVNILRMR
jgi:hypothetical protein